MKKRDWVFLFGFLAVFLIYLYKIPLEIQGNDEAFYLTIPQRILQGDVFVVDEWHGSQLYTFLLVPLRWLRDLFCPDTNGIVLQYRWFYLAFHSLVCLGLYGLIRPYGLSGALAALALYLFTPYDIPALCYNVIGLDMMALTTAMLTAGKKWDFPAGLCFAWAVLCTPHLLLVYGLFSLGVLLLGGRTGRLRLLTFTGGCALLAAGLIGFILLRTDLKTFLASVPALFTDPEHPPVSLGLKISLFFRSFARWQWQLICYGGLLLAAALDRGRRKRTALYLGLAGAVMLWMLIPCLPELLRRDYHAIIFPMALLGPMALLLAKKRDRNLARWFLLGGLGYMFCIHLASNQQGYLICAMSLIPGLGGILLTGRLIGQTAPGWNRAGCRTAAAILAAAQIFLMGYTKVNHKFWSFSENRELTVTIADGPYAGIRVTPRTEAAYTRELAQVRRALEGREGTVLLATKKVWYHLVCPKLQNGAFSAWLSGETDTTVYRLASYYEGNPEKRPDWIYLPPGGKWNMDCFSRELLEGYSKVEGLPMYMRVEAPAPEQKN